MTAETINLLASSRWFCDLCCYLSLNMVMNSLLAHLLTLGIPGWVVFVLMCWATKRKHMWWSGISGLVALLGCYFACVYWFGSPVANVTMELPAAVRGSWITVEGTVFPQDAKVYVLVHPAKADGWWVQPEAIKGVAGAWKADVNLGTPQNGKDTYFQVVAVATTNPAVFDLLCNFELHNGHPVPRPPALPGTKILTVWREQ